MKSPDDSEIASMIDNILSNDDKNQDGFVDYVEYQIAHTRNSK